MLSQTTQTYSFAWLRIRSSVFPWLAHGERGTLIGVSTIQ